MHYVSAAQAPKDERYAALRRQLVVLRRLLPTLTVAEQLLTARQISRIEGEIAKLRSA